MEKQNKKNKKQNFIIFFFVVFACGFFLGIITGIIIEQNIISKTVNSFFSNSDTNITISLNETELVNQLNKTIVPQFKEALIEEIQNERG